MLKGVEILLDVFYHAFSKKLTAHLSPPMTKFLCNGVWKALTLVHFK